MWKWNGLSKEAAHSIPLSAKNLIGFSIQKFEVSVIRNVLDSIGWK
jgi:hypothetical protein